MRDFDYENESNEQQDENVEGVVASLQRRNRQLVLHNQELLNRIERLEYTLSQTLQRSENQHGQ